MIRIYFFGVCMMQHFESLSGVLLVQTGWLKSGAGESCGSSARSFSGDAEDNGQKQLTLIDSECQKHAQKPFVLEKSETPSHRSFRCIVDPCSK